MVATRNIILMCLLIVSSCISKPDFDAVPEIIGNINSLIVPDGFNYETSTSNVLLISVNGFPSDEYIKLEIRSEDSKIADFIVEEGTIEQQIEIPIHISALEIYASTSTTYFTTEIKKNSEVRLELSPQQFISKDQGGTANGNGNENGNGNKTDTDGDGVNDDDDLAPTDPTISQAIYMPSQETYNTIGYEDFWPEEGDYDFNDLVVAFNMTKYMDKSNDLAKVETKFKILAIGAGHNNDFCYSLDIPLDELEITCNNQEINYSVHGYDGMTEIRFSGVKSMFNTNSFVNTVEGETYFEPVEFTITSTLNESAPKTNSNSLAYDLFLRTNGDEGKEIHLAGKHPTGKVNRSYFSTGSDDSNQNANKYYLSKNNLPWAILIPEIWEHPLEEVSLLDAYPNFANFAQGNPNFAWYSDEIEGNKNLSKIFNKNN